MCASSSEPQKLTPYDEFTVFGLPSNHGQYEEETVWDCMRRNDGPPVPRKEMIVQPPKKLMREIEELEGTLRPGGFQPPNRYESARPLTASLVPPRISPRATLNYPTPRGSYQLSNGNRRPLSAVSAYRKAGIEPRGNQLLKSTTDKIEQWRSRHKYEEALLLGHLKAQMTNQVKPPPWKMRQFEFVPPRIDL